MKFPHSVNTKKTSRKLTFSLSLLSRDIFFIVQQCEEQKKKSGGEMDQKCLMQTFNFRHQPFDFLTCWRLFLLSAIMTENQSSNRLPIAVSCCCLHSDDFNPANRKQITFEPFFMSTSNCQRRNFDSNNNFPHMKVNKFYFSSSCCQFAVFQNDFITFHIGISIPPLSSFRFYSRIALAHLICHFKAPKDLYNVVRHLS